MQKQQQAPQLAPYGSMAHLAVVAKVGEPTKSPLIQQVSTRTVTRRNATK